MILQINKRAILEEASHNTKGHEHLSKTKLRLGTQAEAKKFKGIVII